MASAVLFASWPTQPNSNTTTEATGTHTTSVNGDNEVGTAQIPSPAYPHVYPYEYLLDYSLGQPFDYYLPANLPFRYYQSAAVAANTFPLGSYDSKRSLLAPALTTHLIGKLPINQSLASTNPEPSRTKIFQPDLNYREVSHKNFQEEYQYRAVSQRSFQEGPSEFHAVSQKDPQEVLQYHTIPQKKTQRGPSQYYVVSDHGTFSEVMSSDKEEVVKDKKGDKETSTKSAPVTEASRMQFPSNSASSCKNPTSPKANSDIYGSNCTASRRSQRISSSSSDSTNIRATDNIFTGSSSNSSSSLSSNKRQKDYVHSAVIEGIPGIVSTARSCLVDGCKKCAQVRSLVVDCALIPPRQCL